MEAIVLICPTCLVRVTVRVRARALGLVRVS